MRTLLWNFLQSRGLTLTAFGAQTGIAVPLLSNWCRGKRKPGLGYALKLETLTGGIVPASYWASLAVAPAKRGKNGNGHKRRNGGRA